MYIIGVLKRNTHFTTQTTRTRTIPVIPTIAFDRDKIRLQGRDNHYRYLNLTRKDILRALKPDTTIKEVLFTIYVYDRR